MAVAPNPEMIRWYLLGYSTTEISNVYGISRKRLVAYLKENGIELRSGGPLGRRERMLLREALRRAAIAKRTGEPYVPPTPAWTFADIVKDYVENDMSIQELSGKYDMATQDINKILRKQGVTLRPRGARGHIRPARNPNSEKTNCPRGHPYDEENTIYKVRADRGGRVERLCRECNRVLKRARRRALSG